MKLLALQALALALADDAALLLLDARLLADELPGADVLPALLPAALLRLLLLPGVLLLADELRSENVLLALAAAALLPAVLLVVLLVVPPAPPPPPPPQAVNRANVRVRMKRVWVAGMIGRSAAEKGEADYVAPRQCPTRRLEERGALADGLYWGGGRKGKACPRRPDCNA